MSNLATVLLSAVVAAGISAAFWAATSPGDVLLADDVLEHGRWVELDARIAALEGRQQGVTLVSRPAVSVERADLEALRARIAALEAQIEARVAKPGETATPGDPMVGTQDQAVAALKEVEQRQQVLQWERYKLLEARKLDTYKQKLEAASGEERIKLLNRYAQALDTVRDYPKSKESWAELVREAGLDSGVGREAKYNLGWAHRNAGDPSTGREHMLEASRHFPDSNARHWYARQKAADFAFEAGDRDTARREADDLIRDLTGNTKGDEYRQRALERTQALRKKLD